MPNRTFENNLRQVLHQHQTPVDTEALWDKVEPRLPRQDGIAPPFWLVCLIGAVGLGLFFSIPTNTTTSEEPAPGQVLLTPLSATNTEGVASNAEYAPINERRNFPPYLIMPKLSLMVLNDPVNNPLTLLYYSKQPEQTLAGGSAPAETPKPASGLSQQQLDILEQQRVADAKLDAQLAALEAARAERRRIAAERQLAQRKSALTVTNAAEAIEGTRTGKVPTLSSLSPEEEAARAEAYRLAEAQKKERLEVLRAEARDAERKRLALKKEAAERIAAKQASEEANQRIAEELEAQRLAALEIERKEQERMAVELAAEVEQAAQLAAETLAAEKLEKERLAAEDKLRMERKRKVADGLAERREKKKAAIEHRAVEDKEAKRMAILQKRRDETDQKAVDRQAAKEAIANTRQGRKAEKAAKNAAIAVSKRAEDQLEADRKRVAKLAREEVRRQEEAKMKAERLARIESKKTRRASDTKSKTEEGVPSTVQLLREEAEAAAVAQAEKDRKKEIANKKKAAEKAARVALEAKAEEERQKSARAQKIAQTEQARAQQDRQRRLAITRDSLQRVAKAREKEVREINKRNRPKFAAAEREARRQAALDRKTALRERKLALAKQRSQQKADALARQSQRRTDKKARRAQLLATRSEKQARKRQLLAERSADRRAKKARKEQLLADRRADRLSRKADRLALQEAHRAERLAKKSERMAMREARRAERLAARLARRDARRLARAERRRLRKLRPQPYWTAEPMLAVSLPLRSGGGSGDSGSNQDEKSLEGLTFQALAGHHRPNGLSLRSGIIYSRVNSKISSESTEQTTVSQTGVVTIIENPDGSRTEQIGTVQVPQTITTKVKYFNSVTSLDIPLLLGYRFKRSKYSMMLEAGPTLNLSSGGSAHLRTGDGYRSVGGNHFFSKRMGVGLLLQLSGEYQLTEKNALTAGLRIQGMGSFEDPAVAGYQTSYSLIGVSLGYRVRF